MRKLETRHGNKLVVIGVHSAKFSHARETASIREAAQRYQLTHPIVNDRDFLIWKRYGVRAWPTLVLVDPRGRLVWRQAGEVPFATLDQEVRTLERRFKGMLETAPLKKLLPPKKTDEGPLSFPLKLSATSKWLVISDTNHNRLLITNHQGRVLRVAGSGAAGLKDGSLQEARFHHPAGTCVAGNTIFVADLLNHAIRKVDLEAGRVTTLAGTGRQAYRRTGGPALATPLNSPWDLALRGQQLFIAMAGNHAIWVLDLKRQLVAPFAGDGRERLRDGPRLAASFNQPSGLTLLDSTLYVADSEVSGIRAIDLGPSGQTRTLVGTGLFDFGDRDGAGDEVLLQHPLGLCALGSKLYVVDSFNHKLKELDPKSRRVRSVAGDGRGGSRDGKEARFREPSGAVAVDGRIFVADTDNHAIRVADPISGLTTTLKISGLKLP